MTYPQPNPTTTSVPALHDLLRGLLTAAERLLEQDEIAEIPGSSLVNSLLYLAANHPEPAVSNWLTSELLGFTDVSR